ncbi:dCTP deaminase/dUTPase family protein [uncultured Enterococcus sp.]|uniref:dUTP diphosphatase n=1 Tax=uncultured Enterococcus sp. TaxID=167972 RepID=UPI0025E2778A|nr:dUTP diphosphatase [uncultured Enterococcus sp.]
MKKRGFEIVTTYQNQGIRLPIRATKQAAGYDFEAAEDIVIPSVIKQWMQHKGDLTKSLKPTLIPTGIKAYMQEDEFLQLANRSSNPLKRFLMMGNGVGIIDADYYGNDANEGHIMFQYINFGMTDQVIKKGERIGQGIFLPFLKADEDQEQTKATRTGGFGSSGGN